MFTVNKTLENCRARRGELRTLHGDISTPAFMPVGSQGTVKTLIPEELNDIGVPVILSNVYHLYLRPGIEVIEKLGGLHKFMGWDKPILTDSGGYQIFSLAPLCKVTDDGVLFRSHIDGSEHRFTPELAIELQEGLGADIIMALDHCAAHDAPINKVREAMKRADDWAVRCREHHNENGQLLFAIVQGGLSAELRDESATALASLDFPGYAIGGLSLGEPKELTWSVVEKTVARLPAAKPRYLMGVGSPEDLIEGASQGIDLFDSVLPTRVARNGALFTRGGRMNIRKSEYKFTDQPVEAGCQCYTCRTFSTAYLHHLFRCEELLAYRLATIHNLWFVAQLMRDINMSIDSGTFLSFKAEFLSRYKTVEEERRIEQKKKWRSSSRPRNGSFSLD